MWYYIFALCPLLKHFLHTTISSLIHLKTGKKALREIVDKKHPSNSNLVPSEGKIDITKICHGGCITIDICNAAQKLWVILADKIDWLYDYNCMHHL